MRVPSAPLTSALLLTGCSQVTDYFYSKENFTTQSFDADLSECRRQNTAIAAFQANVEDQRTQVDE